MESRAEWKVIRTGGTVRIDVNAALELSGTDREAMIAAAEKFMGDESVSVIQLDGPAFGPTHFGNLAETVRALELLAELYGKPLLVWPIDSLNGAGRHAAEHDRQ